MGLLKPVIKSMEKTVEGVHALVTLKARSVQLHVKGIPSHWIQGFSLLFRGNLHDSCVIINFEV